MKKNASLLPSLSPPFLCAPLASCALSPLPLLSLLHPLPPPGCGTTVVSLVGGGGKTTLLFALAAEARAKGYSVISSTSTKIFLPRPEQSPCLLLTPSPTRLSEALHRYGHVSLGKSLLPQGKVAGLLPEELDDLAASHVADLVLVEADGAAMLPLKAPAGHEPPVPSSTCHSLALWHVRALGCLASEVVHRQERAAMLCGVRPQDRVDTSHVARLLLHPQGMFRTTQTTAKRHVFCVGDAEHRTAAQKVREVARSLYPADQACWWTGSPRDGWLEALV